MAQTEFFDLWYLRVVKRLEKLGHKATLEQLAA